jgi:hypothetical protein
MVEFAHAVRPRAFWCTHCALALVQAHGLTDLRSPARVLPYALAACPLPGGLVTAAFFAASVAHFALDVGACGSVVVHALACAVHARNKTLAFEAMLLYLACFHVPLHYARVLDEASHAARASTALALGATLGACARLAMARPSPPHSVRVSHLQQRIVVAHVASVALSCG